jgi:tetratricopeptide (TPR) repeat protein
MVHAARGDLKAAMEEYRNATFVEGNTPASLNLLGQAYLGLEEYEMAEQVFEEALEMRPDNAVTLVNLSYLMLLEGEGRKARRYVERALKVDSDFAPAHYFRGLCMQTEGKVRGAEKEYRRAAKLDPANPSYPRALGSLYAGVGRWKDAVRAYEKAGEVAGWTVDALMDSAFAHVGANDPRDALRYFEQVVEVEPDNLTAWMNIGLLCHETLRKKAKAIEAYEEYIRRGGKDERVPKWLSDLTGE